ncbi:DEAD/DEAH box helicase [Maribacter litopenaei]|uniref:DNA 3'-5' helicase n=1 Tax=Maribacter litopenaei TaxID=2976127 RepID=A0ABY5YB43_9FLAO|nr:DEAD/DEAH box helicase [Maribacter litopenaei]UWX56261.1 DEAD/DEAH box helicase [Maribacter litopenaei]
MNFEPHKILREYWGYPQFKGSQENIIRAILNGRDVLALLPTGGGKSICFQVPAMAKEGICIVISPLISLIQNQVSQLKNLGIKAIGLTGGLNFEEVGDLLDNCVYGGYKFLYLSPERLEQELIQDRIRRDER